MKRSAYLVLVTCIISGLQCNLSYTLSPEIWNKIGAGCYALSGIFENNHNTPFLVRALSLNSLPKKDGIASLFRRCGLKAYRLQGEVIKENSAKPLRKALLKTLNILGAASHYIAGSQTNRNASAFLHKSGDSIYRAHSCLAHYDGFISGFLDKTDLSKKHHCLALGSATAAVTYLCYKAYKSYMAPPLNKACNDYIVKPAKELFQDYKDKIKQKLQATHGEHDIYTEQLDPRQLADPGFNEVIK